MLTLHSFISIVYANKANETSPYPLHKGDLELSFRTERSVVKNLVYIHVGLRYVLEILRFTPFRSG